MLDKGCEGVWEFCVHFFLSYWPGIISCTDDFLSSELYFLASKDGEIDINELEKR